MTNTALILGATGGFGRNASAAFAAAGWQVRHWQRGTDMAAAAAGADLIVNALNPPNYHNWATLIPAITAEVISAARISGATILVPGNVYPFGNQPGPWGAETPHRPTSRKGQIRAEMEAAYRAASSDGLRVIILRGGDFIDPGNGRTLIALVVMKGAAKGKITTLGAPEAAHAYAYLPDMARAAVALAEMRDSLPAFADIPFAGHNFSIAELAEHLAALSGKPVRVERFAWWMMRLTAPFWELAREVLEMRYLSDLPHRLSPDALRLLLPDFRPTPLREVIAAQMAAMEK